MLILSCSCAYAADYVYATTNMTWAEFYAGETNQTASDLTSAGLDAVSTATVRFTNRFNATVSSVSDSGSTYTGLKDVPVRMTQEFYDSLSDKSRYTLSTAPFTEYKEVTANGFGKMVTETKAAASAGAKLASGPSVNHGDYMLNVSSLNLESLGLKFGEGSSFDYYYGVTIETQEGKTYGLRPLYNIWVNTSQLGFSVEDFKERNGTVISSKYTSDLVGKTVKKITFLLKDQPDPYIDCNVYVKGPTTATVEPVYEDGFTGFEISGQVSAKLRVNNAPSDSNYNAIASISYDDPSGHHGWSTLPADSYTYSDGVLTITGDIASKTHTYNIVLEDSNNKYINIGTSFKAFTTDATSLIISRTNNPGGVNFLLTPEGMVSSVDTELESGNFVNASDYTSPDYNYSVPLSGKWHQVEGSGFSFDITLNNLPSGKTAVVGFGKIFYLTPDNCGEIFPMILSSLKTLETYPSGFKLVQGDMFRSMGLRVLVADENSTGDITSIMGAGAMIADDENIMIYYGVMLADANEGEIKEGGTYAFSPEGETLISDRKRDGHLKIAIYFEVLNSESGTVEDENNEAGIGFSYMSEGYFDVADEAAEEAKVKWLSKAYNNYLSGGYSEFVTGYANQIAGNSGFTFSIPVDASKIPSGYSAISGFERPFSFTASNIGTDDYATLQARIAALPASEGSEWKSPGDNGGAILRAANIHVIAIYPDNTSRDVTNEIQYGIMESNNSIIINYGAIAVDRALTSNEGEKLNLAFEESPLMSDGLADGYVTATWYFAHYTSSGDDPTPKGPGSSGGGCEAFSISSAGLILALTIMKLRRR